MQFEKTFIRLEEILQKMNAGSVPLDESLKLYEEADKLMGECMGFLSKAEEKIEVLIKKRNGELTTDAPPEVALFHETS